MAEHEEATKEYGPVVSMAPNGIWAHNELGIMYDNIAEFTHAIAELQGFIEQGREVFDDGAAARLPRAKSSMSGIIATH